MPLIMAGLIATVLPTVAYSADHSPHASAESEPTMFNRLFSKSGKNQPLPDLPALQADAVRSVVGDITDLQDGEWEERDWVYIAVNHEVLIEDGRRSSSQASVLAHRAGAELEDLDFRLSRESKEKLLALRDAMATGGKDPWTVLDLTIERSGQFNFTFDYGPPPRINGDLLHSPLSGLLERYLAEQDAKQ